MDSPRPEQLHALMAHDWPGNVRELRNAAERYVLLGCDCAFDLDILLQDGPEEGAPTLPQQVDCFEKGLIEQALAAHRGSIKDTMAALGVPRKTLYDKMQKYGLDRRTFKAKEQD